jgi:hypothetical protein
VNEYAPLEFVVVVALDEPPRVTVIPATPVEPLIAYEAVTANDSVGVARISPTDHISVHVPTNVAAIVPVVDQVPLEFVVPCEKEPEPYPFDAHGPLQVNESTTAAFGAPLTVTWKPSPT